MATISAPGYPSFKNYTLATFNQSLLINNNLCTLRMCPLVLDGVPLAHLVIYVQSCFRVAELSQGFHSSLANSQIMFMILEGAMIVLASFLLTVLNPDFVIGREAWTAAGWNAGTSNQEPKSMQSSGKWWKFSRETTINEKVGSPNL